MSNSEPQRQEDPDALWKMIDERDARIAELNKYGQHWYNGNSGNGDSYKYHCKCGESWYEKTKLDSHIEWKLAVLKAKAKGELV